MLIDIFRHKGLRGDHRCQSSEKFDRFLPKDALGDTKLCKLDFLAL